MKNIGLLITSAALMAVGIGTIINANKTIDRYIDEIEKQNEEIENIRKKINNTNYEHVKEVEELLNNISKKK